MRRSLLLRPIIAVALFIAFPACVPVMPGMDSTSNYPTDTEEESSSSSRGRRSSSTSSESGSSSSSADSSSNNSTDSFSSTSDVSSSSSNASSSAVSSTSHQGTVEGMRIVLRWTPGPTDLDLHLIREDAQGTFPHNTEADCYFDTCLPNIHGPLWDETSAPHAGGNPTLLADNIVEGPETVVVQSPRSGRYMVAVWSHNDVRAFLVETTVQTYLDGTLTAETQAWLDPNMFWDVGIIGWSSETFPTWEVLPLPGQSTSSSGS